MERFAANAREALRNETQRRALRRATDLFGDRRRSAMEALPEWEPLRDRARAIKDEALAGLDRHLESFVTHAESAGARVHWAPGATEATRIIVRLAQDRGVRTVVKSKSMTTEEIKLNEALEQAGLETVETDLGEWIVQLAGEAPSHIIVPAIHKTKDQIAALFADQIGTSRDDDVQALTLAARRVLREKFATAGLGISGVNFAVAETGTIVIVENEGNARFTTSLPRTHIAVMGIEKVIPRFRDLEIFLRLLPRSGTGQHLTSYVSFLTGPKRSADGEGPEELHLVILDNGRSRVLGAAVTRQSLACIRCGACLNACPVYQQVGGHAYGSVYPGPIGAVITPQLAGLKKAAALPFASTLCAACRDVCPVKIDIPALLLHLRSEIKQAHPPAAAPPDPSERRAFRFWAWLMGSARHYEWSTRLARVLQRLVVRDNTIARIAGLAARLFPPLGTWTAERDLRPLAPRPFRDLWREHGSDRRPQRPGGPPHPIGSPVLVPSPPVSASLSQALTPSATSPVASTPPGFDLGFRQSILAAIRFHLAQDPTAATVPACGSPPPIERPALDREVLAARFIERLESVGGSVHRARSLEEAAEAIRKFLNARGVRRVAWSDAALLDGVRLRVRAETDFVNPTREELLHCDAGITTAHLGVAETGTLVLSSDAERSRLGSLLPPLHIAVLPLDRLVDDLGSALDIVAGEPPALPPAVTFITGPSRTADIELTLVVGVHGPRDLCVLLLDSEALDSAA
jgi:L-lactate dehydrogenase complex protein LldF